VSGPVKVNKWLVALSVTFGTLMGAVDASIVNVALSQIRGSVGATLQEITWISTGFSIATVMVMPLTAFVGRLYGQKNVYLACLALFVVGSALCGIAWNLPSLIVFRALQGFGAGALQPTEQAILRTTFPPKEQATAMALFAMAVMIGPALGPTLGGFIVDHFHWSWIFFINVPVGILGFFMVTRFVHEPEDLKAKARVEAERQRRNMDWLGIALLWGALIALQYVLEEGQADDWFESPAIVVATLVFVFAAIAFVARELTAEVPAVNLRLFKDPVFTSGSLAYAGMFGVMISGMFLLPLFMQELLGFTATQSGLAMMPRTLAMMVCVPLMARVYRYVRPAVLATAGVLVTSWGMFSLSGLNLDSNANAIMGSLIVQGLGMSMMMVPLQTVALSNVPRERMPDATGLNSLMRQIGGSLGIAVFATILSRQGVIASAGLRAHLVAERPEVQARLAGTTAGLMARGMSAADAQSTALRSLAGTVARQGMVLAFDHLFVVGVIAFACVIPLALMLRRPVQAPQPAHVELE
jgi:DHA2 family multidrug resistance protein